MKNIEKSRVNYFAGASFWACEDSMENRRILANAGILFWSKTFQAADGSHVSRLEWND